MSIKKKYWIGVFVLVGWPIISLPVALIPFIGFETYLVISNIYYSIASFVLPETLVTYSEFGSVPRNWIGYMAVAGFYWCVYTVIYFGIEAVPGSDQRNSLND